MTESTTIATSAPDDHAFTESVQILQQHIDQKEYPQAIAKYNECQQKYGADGNPIHHEALARLTPLLDRLKYLHAEENVKIALDKCWHFIKHKWAPLAQSHLTQAKDWLDKINDIQNIPSVGKYQKRITRYEEFIHTLNKTVQKSDQAKPTPIVPIQETSNSDLGKGSFQTELTAHEYQTLSLKFSASPDLQVILPAVGGIYYHFFTSRPELHQAVISVIVLSKKIAIDLPSRDTFATIRHQLLTTEALTDLFTAGFPNCTLLPNLRARIGHTIYEVDITFLQVQEEYPEIVYSDGIWECPLVAFPRFLQYLKARYDAYHRVKFEYYQNHHYFLLRARTFSRIAYTIIGLSGCLIILAMLEGFAVSFPPILYGLPGIPIGFMLGFLIAYRRKDHKIHQIVRLLHPMSLPSQIKTDLIHILPSDHHEFVECEFGLISTMPPIEDNQKVDNEIQLHSTNTHNRKSLQLLLSWVQRIVHSIRNQFGKIHVKKTVHQISHGLRVLCAKIPLKIITHRITQGGRVVIQKTQHLFGTLRHSLSHRRQPNHTHQRSAPKSTRKQEINDYFSS